MFKCLRNTIINSFLTKTAKSILDIAKFIFLELHYIISKNWRRRLCELVFPSSHKYLERKRWTLTFNGPKIEMNCLRIQRRQNTRYKFQNADLAFLLFFHNLKHTMFYFGSIFSHILPWLSITVCLLFSLVQVQVKRTKLQFWTTTNTHRKLLRRFQGS